MLLAICASIVSIVFFLCMAWAVRGHFSGRVALGMHVASAVNAAAMVWFIEERWRVLSNRSPVPPWREAAAVAITLAALALFWWAVATTRRTRLTLAFSADQPTFLVDQGPYAVVRHPFYTSYILFWIGAAIDGVSPLFWIAPIVITVLYARAASIEERKFVQSALATRYRDYQNRTGMLLPRPWSSTQGTKR